MKMCNSQIWLQDGWIRKKGGKKSRNNNTLLTRLLQSVWLDDCILKLQHDNPPWIKSYFTFRKIFAFTAFYENAWLLCLLTKNLLN